MMSAIWGTIRLLKSRSPNIQDENDWTFGQILPVFLLTAPALAILEYFGPVQDSAGQEENHTNQQPHQLNEMPRNIIPSGVSFVANSPSSGADTAPRTSEVNESSPQLVEQIHQEVALPRHGGRRLTQLTRYATMDYYPPTQYNRLVSATLLIFAQIIMLTVVMFLDLSYSNTSAVSVFAKYAYIIFIFHPLACLFAILFLVLRDIQGASISVRPYVDAILVFAFSGSFSLFGVFIFYFVSGAPGDALSLTVSAFLAIAMLPAFFNLVDIL